MYITLSPEQLDTNNIVVSERTINNIMDNAYFYRIFYSDEYMNLNGIFIYFTLTNIKIEKYFNKIKCFFLDEQNKAIIEKIKNIEKYILEKFGNFNLKKKIPTYRIEELRGSLLVVFSPSFISILTNAYYGGNIEVGKCMFNSRRHSNNCSINGNQMCFSEVPSGSQGALRIWSAA